MASNAPPLSGKGALGEGRATDHYVAGGGIDQPVIWLDLFRTFAEPAGVKGETKVDGISL